MLVSDVPAFAICLQRKPAAAQAVASWQKAFKSVQMVKAVDAKTLNVQQDPRIHDLVRSQIQYPDMAADTVFALPSVGAVGCALSHYALMRKCEKRNRPMVVLEQDAVLSDTAIRTFRSLRIPPDADFVSLLYIRQPNLAPRDHTFDRITGPHCDGMQCYYITPRGAAKILDKAFPIVTQNDLLVGIVAHTDPTFVALSLRQRLYSLSSVFWDNVDSNIQSFRVKKYLPRSNWFYYVLLIVFVYLLLMYLC